MERIIVLASMVAGLLLVANSNRAEISFISKKVPLAATEVTDEALDALRSHKKQWRYIYPSR